MTGIKTSRAIEKVLRYIEKIQSPRLNRCIQSRIIDKLFDAQLLSLKLFKRQKYV